MSEWQDIKTAPKDGSWFMIGRAGEGPESYEIGRYSPFIVYDYIEQPEGLYRKEPKTLLEWCGFNNFHRATHWMPLPEPPK